MDNVIDIRFQLLKSDQHGSVGFVGGVGPLAILSCTNTVGRKVSLKPGSKLEGTPMEKDCANTRASWL